MKPTVLFQIHFLTIFGLRNPEESNGFSHQADGLWPREPSGAGRIGGRCRGLVQGARAGERVEVGKKWLKPWCTICGMS